MKKKFLSLFLALAVVLPLMTFPVSAQTIKFDKENNEVSISFNGYDYGVWLDGSADIAGSGSITIGSDDSFSCEWKNSGNICINKGKHFDSSRTHSEIGNISIDYNGSFEVSSDGFFYFTVAGWIVDPMIEFYIIENWENYRPEGNLKGQINVDGGTYDIYESIRVDAPSIEGITTFKQYISVRIEKRTSGTISVSKHFEEWEKLGMKSGGIHNICFGFESGGGNNGKANISKIEFNFVEKPIPIINLPAGDTKYNFNQLRVIPRSDINTLINSNGILNINYIGTSQYREAKFVLSEAINFANCNSIIANAFSAEGRIAVRFYDISGEEAFVIWNIKGSSAKDYTWTLSAADKTKIIRTIGIMSQEAGNYSATVNSITFNCVASDNFTTADALAILRDVVGSQTITDVQKMKYGFEAGYKPTTSDALAVLRMVVGIT
ncbi:MAG: glycoside hydrolase family 11 protein [Oscillospiraceae bacterium]|nr:glycoside hydrolase family 11 protein [Oscillospiraceae bacterium]